MVFTLYFVVVFSLIMLVFGAGVWCFKRIKGEKTTYKAAVILAITLSIESIFELLFHILSGV